MRLKNEEDKKEIKSIYLDMIDYNRGDKKV